MEELQPDLWLQKIIDTLKPTDYEPIRQAVALGRLVNEGNNISPNNYYLTQGLITADILQQLNIDAPSLAAAILLPSTQHIDLKFEDITEHLGEHIAKLIQGVHQMSIITEFYHGIPSNSHYQYNINNIRKMVLAMVDDIRIVIIKLAEQLYILRNAHIFPEKIQTQLAKETMAIYAPLCNRLGISQFKWELEDHAFRFLEPKKYYNIANTLAQHFPEGRQYVDTMVNSLQKMLASQKQIKNYNITGRVKHIYSIHRKIEHKKAKLDAIYDISAIRIFVPTITDCYKILSLIHNKWQYIQDEFDDYIASPKSNGYRSLHTAIYGLDNRIVEIQIRTYRMHRHAELGVAAHWMYKECKQEIRYQAKLSWLRQIIDWQKELSTREQNSFNLQQIFNNYIYVFTPKGDIFEFPKGATPLDLAYHIHSEIGHRCCGAKINGNIVPLTYNLKTGDRVEILTANNGTPSRDWIIPYLGFLTTPRAKAKVLHWFKKQGQEHNVIQGQILLDKETKRLNLPKLDLKKAATKLCFKTPIDLLAALGEGNLKFSTLLYTLNIELTRPLKTTIDTFHTKFKKKKYVPNINIQGVGNLLVELANCCQPIPGEDILGYITHGRGITIHRANCINVLNSLKHNSQRHIAVSWDKKNSTKYLANITIKAFDRAGLIRDITNILAEKNITVTACNYITNKNNRATFKMTIEVPGFKSLNGIMQIIGKISNVLEVYRCHNN